MLTRSPGLLIALVAALAAGCGEFSNEGLEALGGGPEAPPPAALESPSPLAVPPALLTVSPDGASLPEAWFGHPYAVQFTVTGESSGPVCWRVESGKLPLGLALASDTGLLSGRLTDPEAGQDEFRIAAYAPCDAPSASASGVSQPFYVTRYGRCAWDLDCRAPSKCRADGVCRVDAGESCPQAVGPGLRFEPVEPLPGGDRLYTVSAAKVIFEGLARRGSLCEASDRELVLVDPSARSGERTFCYRNPGESVLPVQAGDLVDLTAYIGGHADRYAMLRTADQVQGWSWAAWSGHGDWGRMAAILCGSHKFCPFVSDATIVLSNGCNMGGACDAATAGLQIAGLGQIVWPGQQTPWGPSVSGKSLYTLLLSEAWAEERCANRQMAGGATYVLLEGYVPHPLMRVRRSEVALDTIPSLVSIDGAASIGAAQNADASSYIDRYDWEVVSPAGSPRTAVDPSSPSLAFPVYVVGDYVVRLRVQDYKTGLRSEDPAEARVVVRPGAGIHIELVWSDADADLNLSLLPPGADGNWGSDSFAAASEGILPTWTNKGGKKVVTLASEPDGLPLEVLQVDSSLAETGSYVLAVESSPGTDRPITASVRVYAFGTQVDGGRWEHLTIHPNDFLKLGRIDAIDGAISPPN
jgi:hypothetical protein